MVDENKFYSRNRAGFVLGDQSLPRRAKECKIIFVKEQLFDFNSRGHDKHLERMPGTLMEESMELYQPKLILNSIQIWMSPIMMDSIQRFYYTNEHNSFPLGPT